MCMIEMTVTKGWSKTPACDGWFFCQKDADAEIERVRVYTNQFNEERYVEHTRTDGLGEFDDMLGITHLKTFLGRFPKALFQEDDTDLPELPQRHTFRRFNDDEMHESNMPQVIINRFTGGTYFGPFTFVYMNDERWIVLSEHARSSYSLFSGFVDMDGHPVGMRVEL
jgi:hypothetical protein